ncbi:MAG: nitrate- and nitrite sensing domain-containing protein [Neomegalonema sp.]|nr:nitrate- and nitrite sensing domain-containing protein [Neomegalonema sp.]
MLAKLRVRTRVLLLLLLPVLTFLIVGGMLSWEAWRKHQSIARIEATLAYAPALNAVVHELQRERGASAGFLASKGGKVFKTRLQAQRRDTDRAVADLLAMRQTAELAGLDAHFSGSLSHTFDSLAALAGKRREIDKLGLAVPQMARFYTGIISRTIELIAETNRLSAAPRIGAGITAYVAILQEKEHAGLERAMGAVGFGAGHFEIAPYRELLDMIGQQHAFQITFRETATPEQIAAYDEIVSGADVQEVERLREIAINSITGGSLQGITGGQWFDAITRKIDKLKLVEDRLVEDLLSLIADQRGQARNDLMAKTIGIVALLSIMLVMGGAVAHSVTRPLANIREAIKDLLNGTSETVPGLERRDEIGELARGMEHVFQKGLEAARLRSALDGCSTMVMVVNRRNQVIYVNPQLEAMFGQYESDFQRDFGRFEARALIGEDAGSLVASDFDLGKRCAAVNKPTRERVKLGGRDLILTMNPVLNEVGAPLGVVVEWADRTSELAMQDQIDLVIDAARAGDFSKSIDLSGMDGSYERMGSGMNRLVEVVAGAIDDFALLLGKMAQGDLTHTITRDYEGRFGELKANANETVHKIARTVGEIKNTAERVDLYCRDLAQSAEQLSSRSEATAASLEETSASTTEITQSVRETAQSAGSANAHAASARDIASRGKQIANQSIEAMTGINSSSQKVSAIVTVIDEIAFQTNLLALNASVEAARAGEAGKGFAVVASEVRTLAQRSAQAASDIKELIDTSVQEVQVGVDLAARVDAALEEIVSSIGQVSEIIAQISHSANEQATGVAEISSSVSHMDSMTQENSAMVQQSTSATRSLSDLASHLNEMAAFFKVPAQSSELELRVA